MKTNLVLAVLFILPVLLGLWWFAAPYDGAFGWMPEHINEAYGNQIDGMYIIIFIVVAVMFLLTEGFLIYAIFAYRAREGVRATYSHGSKKAELMWTIVPGIMLIALAIGQSWTWAQIRYDMPSEDDPNVRVIQVFAEQFNWNFRYSKDNQFGNEDDVADLGALTIPAEKKVLLNMSSKDVIHSLFLPHLRFKQDLTPGMMTKSWIQADRIAVWNIKKQLEDHTAGKKDAYNYLEFLTADEFQSKKVASNWESAKAFVFQNEEVNNRTRRRFWYDADGSAQIQIWRNGSPTTGSASEVEYILHSLDLACAELCGPQHYTMAGILVVLPQSMFDYWLDQHGKTSANDVFDKVWDKFYPHYNGKP